MEETKDVFAKKPQKGEPWDVAIIGSGPAGLTAAIYTTRGAASTLILGGEKWGGQLMLTTTVDNFPGFPDGVQGPDLMAMMRKQAERFGAEWVQQNVTSVDFAKKPFELTAGGVKYLAKTVIITTGAQDKRLGVPGEDEFFGRGVSTCAPCDAPFFKNKKVAVVGGGDTAMTEALVLTKYATEVVVIHRRDKFKASVAMQEQVTANPKIKVIWNTEITEVIGSGKVEKLKLRNIKDQSVTELPVDGMFVAIGHKPDSELFKGPIEMDENGYIKKFGNSDQNKNNEYKMATSVPGVFVAGEVHDKYYRQAVTTAAFGCMAGMEVLDYLSTLK